MEREYIIAVPKLENEEYIDLQKVINWGYSNLNLDRTTSQVLGNSAKSATVGVGAGLDAQRNKNH